MRFFSSAGEWDDENCTMALPFACVKSKGAFFILNENMVVLHSWSACCFLVTFTFFFFSQARNSLTAGLAFLTGTVCRCHFFIVIIVIIMS